MATYSYRNIRPDDQLITDSTTGVIVGIRSAQGITEKLFFDAASPPTLSTLVIGTSTNNTTFEADGTMVLNGTATIWDDVVSSGINLQQAGPGVSINGIESTVDFIATSNLSDYVFLNVQMPHRWKVGSVVHPHIHYPQDIAGVPNWLFQYRWQKLGGTKTTAWTYLKCNTAALTYTAGTINQIAKTAVGITPPTGSAISDVLQLRVIRDVVNGSAQFAGADPINAVVALDSIDVHFEADGLGSHSEYTK
jgi:hypothetical protein